MTYRRKPMLGFGSIVVLVCLLVLTRVPGASAQGYQGAEKSTGEGISITECVVYSDNDASLRYDCTARAQGLCNGPPKCELPIGLSLSGGKDIDGNPDTWEKVKVKYSCGKKNLARGPHEQNDHGWMVLSCTAR